MKNSEIFVNLNSIDAENTASFWNEFLIKNNFNFSSIEKIDMATGAPVIYDLAKNKFSIDFLNNKTNYHKKKSSIKTELISKAMGAGKSGFEILDLSAGLGIDAVFLAQLGYNVTAVERNPLVYLALSYAQQNHKVKNLNIVFGEALNYINTEFKSTDVIYFDPMFPDKIKSALPRQEMVFFKNLVGHDNDASLVLHASRKLDIKKVVIKRPLKAAYLADAKPLSQYKGKLIRFDVYGAN